MDKEYLKKIYTDYWPESVRRELVVKAIIEKETSQQVKVFGNCAGSVDYVPVEDEAPHLKGDADLLIESLKCFVEVTGSHERIPFCADVLVKPHKMVNAHVKHIWGFRCFVVHIHEAIETGDIVISVLPIDERFLKNFLTGAYKIVYRGKRHGIFWAIPYNDDNIITFGQFIKQLKNGRTKDI